MKIAVVLLTFVALSCSAPQPRKLFHEHFEDFIYVIIEETGEELEAIAETYLQFDEFVASVNYLQTANFRDLVFEMESLPEFIAVVNFLEKDNIDILYFIDILNEAIGSIDSLKMKRSQRQQISGTDMNSYLRDITATFPKNRLSALYDEKMEKDEEFRVSMENLRSDEWNELFGALWDSATFQKEVQQLSDNGIDLQLVIAEILAIFGQL